jgi:hypothetical protein
MVFHYNYFTFLVQEFEIYHHIIEQGVRHIDT